MIPEELAIVLPYLFGSDLQYNLRQDWLQWLLWLLQLEETEQLITMPVKVCYVVK